MSVGRASNAILYSSFYNLISSQLFSIYTVGSGGMPFDTGKLGIKNAHTLKQMSN